MGAVVGTSGLPVAGAFRPTRIAISGSPGSAVSGVAYSFTPTITGGFGTASFSLSGSLPAGLSFNSATGAITGTPTTPGTTSGIVITVTDSTGQAALTGLAIVVDYQRTIVGNQNNMLNQLSSLQRGFSGSIRRRSGQVGWKSISVRYPHFYYNSSGVITRISAPYTSKCSARVEGVGAFNVFTQDGNATHTIDPTTGYYTDIDVNVAVGTLPDNSFIEMIISVDGGAATLPRTGRGNPAYDKGAFVAGAPSDPTNGGAAYTALPALSSAYFMPWITGVPLGSTKSIIIDGDSHGYSNNSTIDANSNTSIIEILIANQVPFINRSLAGRRAESITAVFSGGEFDGLMRTEVDNRQFDGLAFTHHFNLLGTNDILGAVSGTISANHIAALATAQAHWPGIIGVSNTILPLTSGSFGTLDGQVLRNSGALESNRLNFNTLRTTKSNCGGVEYIDVAGAAQTVNSAAVLVWNVIGGMWTDDGTHPTRVGADGVAAVAGIQADRLRILGY